MSPRGEEKPILVRQPTLLRRASSESLSSSCSGGADALFVATYMIYVMDIVRADQSA
jgi:hypothetical protein